MFKSGDVVVLKTTGEMAIVLGPAPQAGWFSIRRPVMTRDGIIHEKDVMHELELESSEDHLNREANEMILKVRIQEEMQEKIDDLKHKEGKKLSLVN